MLSVLRYPFRLAIFWLLFFFVFRLWFVLWLFSRWSDKHPLSVWPSFYHALPLDMSMAGYLMLVPLLLWAAGQVAGARAQPFFEKSIHWFNYLLVGVLVLVFGANIFLYEEWDTLLNHRALAYMRTPRALLDSMSGVFKVVSVLLYVSFLLMGIGVYKRVAGRVFSNLAVSRWQTLWLLPLLALTALAIRGGVGVMPINESAVAYSDHIFDNHAATNTAWHLIHSQLEARNAGNAYHFMDDQQAKNALTDLMITPGMNHKPWAMLPDSSRPNLVFILMESMTAQVIEELGGEAGVCPNFSALIREGVLFERCYASGFRTDQGLVAVLGGYPAQPDQSIVLQSDKAETL
ncbi:MAG: hypothetical protein IT269_08020, partial [Saprospiraceae bacterium]|nr:hypothetical protein [Saprospiraceae bacterium]